MKSSKQPATEVFRNALKFLMRREGIKQSPLADKTKVSQKTISNVLSGKQVPTIETVEKLAAAFGLQAWEMLFPPLIEQLNGEAGIDKLFQNYRSASAEGRRHIMLVSEREAEYTTKK